MIIRICCCCPTELGPPINDGKEQTAYSHGFCQRHYDEAMSNLNSQFAELRGDRAHGGEHERAV